jgi:GNAT superfamily N-acetyltransferase
MTKVIIKRYLSKDIYNREDIVRRLYQLTGVIGEGWYESGLYIDLYRKRRGRIFLAWHDKKIVGWSFLTQNYDGRYQVGVYVDKNYRRQGIGGSLAARAKAIARAQKKMIIGDYHDKPSSLLFSSQNIKDGPYKWADSRW